MSAIDDYEFHKRRLEDDARALSDKLVGIIAVELRAHRDACGWTPCAIDVLLIETTSYSDKRRDYAPRVTVTVRKEEDVAASNGPARFWDVVGKSET